MMHAPRDGRTIFRRDIKAKLEDQEPNDVDRAIDISSIL
jgi:hypothetical protein